MRTAGRVLLAATMLLACVAVYAPSVARATPPSTVIGQAQSDANVCANDFDVVQYDVAEGNGYRVPANGVLTSWSTLAGPDGGVMQLEVWRESPGPPGTFMLVGISPEEILAASAMNTFVLRPPIAVRTGDFLGLRVRGADCALKTNDESDETYGTPFTEAAPTPRSIQTLPDFLTGYRLDVTANLRR